ncbi:MAG: hypothetical protein NT161_00165 [Candidatus Nomurabacteria bacterium]|nr:hypothetical protein [Candidatus Nomurabacteria bacterium]
MIAKIMDFINLYFLWKPARILPKQKEEQAEDSSPDPSSSACDIRIQKKGISRSFAESFPQKIVSAKLRPHCFRFLHQDCFQKRFEFCTMNTAIFRKGLRNQKNDRHEVPSVLNSPQKILILKGFATLRVAPR